MKAVINEKETPVKPKYPYLGNFKSKGCDYIVYFINEGEGVVVWDDNGVREGKISTEFIEEQFTPFTGSITLSND